MHQRSLSGSTRIPIPASPASVLDARLNDRSSCNSNGSTSSQLSIGQRKSSNKRSSPKATDHGSGSSNNGVQDHPTLKMRITRRHLGILALFTVSLYVLFTRSSFPTIGIKHAKRSSFPFGSKVSTKSNIVKQSSGTIRSTVVDGKVFQKLRDLENAAGYTDEDDFEAREADRLPHNANGPRPIYILDGKPKAKLKTSSADAEATRQAFLAPAEQADAEYCPSQPDGCKFLLAAWLGEQETKAQMHLHQLGLLAVALNRTLVLPNVSKSRMLSCATQPFDFYYEPNSLEQLGIPSVPFETFVKWSSNRRPNPTSQIVTISTSKIGYPQGALEVDSALDPALVPSSTKRKLCLEPPRTYLDFSTYSPLWVYPPVNWYKSAESRLHFGESIINTLKSDMVISRSYRQHHKLKKEDTPVQSSSPAPPDVLVFNYELRYPILSHEHLQNLALYTPGISMSHPDIASLQPFSHFSYSTKWINLASQLSASLSPFIAVHWRQETLPSSAISPCGDALIEKLLHLTSEQYPNIKTIYLATDYPLEDLDTGRDGVTAHSGTFTKLLNEEHHSAMQRFLKEFNKRLTIPRGVNLTTLAREQENLKLPKDLEHNNARKDQPERPLSIADLDAGLLGIIDKNVAMNAEIFITGQSLGGSKDLQNFACAKESSFTKQISQARKAMRSESVGLNKLWSESKNKYDSPRSSYMMLTVRYRTFLDDVLYWSRQKVET